jgi:hypothetical protein
LNRLDENLHQYCTFDGDDVFIGSNSVVFAKESRRFVINDLKSDQIVFLKLLRDAGNVSTSGVDLDFVNKLCGEGLIRCENSESFGLQFKIRLLIRSKWVALLSKPFVPFCKIQFLILFTVCGFVQIANSISYIAQYNFSVFRFAISDFLNLYFLVLLTSLLHELGHASTCLSISGNVGWIRVKLTIPFPQFVVDVTPIQRNPEFSKVQLAFSGVAFQFAACCVIGFLTNFGLMRSELGNLVVFLVACRIFQALLPVTGSDGSVILHNLSGLNSFKLFNQQKVAFKQFSAIVFFAIGVSQVAVLLFLVANVA